MGWEKLFRGQKTGLAAALSFLGMCMSVLFDFLRVASKISRAFPVIGPFLPLIAIGGIIFVGSWLIGTMWSRRPAARFGKCYNEIIKCRNLIQGYRRGNRTVVIYNSLVELADTLRRLRIRCPNISSGSEKHLFEKYLFEWRDFLTELAPLARHSDLRKARRLKLPQRDK